MTETTVNGIEIEHPRERMNFQEFKHLVVEHGLAGKNPEERLKDLKALDPNNLALLLTDINKRIQGSDASLINNETSYIGDTETIAPNDRYMLFRHMCERIAQTPDNISPARVGDVVAVTTLLLHPFVDGNGRTARAFSMIFRDYFDDNEGDDVFNQLATSRDEARASKSESIVVGYIPYFEEGADQAKPQDVADQIDKMLSPDYANEWTYLSPYNEEGNRATFYRPTANVS